MKAGNGLDEQCPDNKRRQTPAGVLKHIVYSRQELQCVLNRKREFSESGLGQEHMYFSYPSFIHINTCHAKRVGT